MFRSNVVIAPPQEPRYPQPFDDSRVISLQSASRRCL